MASFNFNANQVEGDVKDFSPIPKGKYHAVIINTELVKPNEKKTEQLKVEWEITEGPCAKRHVSNWITVSCPTSKEAQEIGLRFLKNVCESVGMAGFTDSDELCGRAHIIDIGERKDLNDATKIFNEVKRCYPSGGATVTQSAPATGGAQASTAQPTSVTTGNKPPPWAKK